MKKCLFIFGLLTLLAGMVLAHSPPDIDQGNAIVLTFDQPDALDFDAIIVQDIAPVQTTSIALLLVFNAPVSPLETTMVYTIRLSSDLTWNTWSQINLSDTYTDNRWTGPTSEKETNLLSEGLFRLDIGEISMIF